MDKVIKIARVLIFTVLLLIIGVFVWQFFDPYARLMLIPLGVLNIYYLLIYCFAWLLQRQTSKIWLYAGIVLVVLPLIAFSVANKQIMDFSLNVFTAFTR